MLLLSRQKDEELYIIPIKDPNYLANTIKIKVDDFIEGNIVRLALEYNENYTASDEKGKLEKIVFLEKDKEIKFTPVDETRREVTITLTNIKVERAIIGIGCSKYYAVHRKEIFEAIQKDGSLEKELGLGEK